MKESPKVDRTVLVIDDEPGFAHMIVDFMRGHGYDASYASNLEDAVNLFKKKNPRVVLLDCNMPIATGEKFMPILQSIRPDVRVIVVSGMLKEEIEEKFGGLDYYAFFQKGTLSIEALKKKIDEALGP